MAPSPVSPYRFGIFLALFVIFGGYEVLYRRRQLRDDKIPRWIGNLSLFFVGFFMIWVVFPAGLAGLAFKLDIRNWGLLSFLSNQRAVRFIATLLVLDLSIYWLHRLFHQMDFIWRFHRIHHADRDVDVSTSTRFHPVEILFLVTGLVLVVSVLGASTSGTIVFEILLGSALIFTHSNLALPDVADTLLRFVFVTPDMHRIHHSVLEKEMHSNFGFIFSFWDRIFGTYIDEPKEMHESMPVGLAEERESPTASFRWSLLAPFR